jgi:geranylgeranyl diphosphate synthase, type II
MYNPTELKEVIEKALSNLSYNQEAVKLIDPVSYIISIGGKRLRPVMALLSCNLFSDKIEEAIIPAAGLEVFHNFTLVHDDVMDKADMRRGFPTVHKKWNLNQAILSGDVMAFIANECILQTPPHLLLKVFKVFNKVATEVCVGQQLDMDFEKATIVSQNEYLRMIELKTAVLLASSLKIGALIGGCEDKDANLLYEFGRNLGLAFQIQDDMLDIWGDSKIFGKRSGGDIAANKKTFPLIKALELGSQDQIRKLQELFSDREQDTSEKILKVIAIFNDLNIRKKTEELANEYFSAGFNFLQKVNVDESRKKELTNLASSLIGRDR